MSNTPKCNSFLIPSISNIIFITLLFVLSFSMGHILLRDGDTGYHIRAGEYIIDTLSIPKQDIFSYMSPPIPWTAHEWLAEVIMAITHRAFGITGLVILFSFIISLIYSLLFKIIHINNSNIFIAIVITLLALYASRLHWLARPHIFSLLLFLIWYYLLDEYHYRKGNYLYLLPPMILIWTNLHGGFITGFILLGIYLFSNTVHFIMSKDEKKMVYKEKVRVIGLVSVICLFVCLINPYGYKILLFPFNLLSNKFIMNNVMEFLSPNFHASSVYGFELFLLLILVILGISRNRLTITEGTLVVLFTHMSLFSARYILLFCIIASPILMKKTQQLLESADGKIIDFVNKRSINVSKMDAYAKGYIWLVVPILIIVILASRGKIDYKFDPKTFPVAAVKFLNSENIQGNMFNNDEFGDYIIYAIWPKYKVFFDGRSDMYGNDRIKEYLKVKNIKPGWDEVLKKYNITWIIYNANSSLSLFLMERHDWKLVYADKIANIFVKDIPENQLLIQKYPDVQLYIEKDE